MFYLSFIIVLLVALTTAYLLHTQAPNMNGILRFFVIPLAVAYAVLLVINNLLPHVNSAGQSGYNYIEDKIVGGLNNMEYFQVFPPLFGVLIIFMLLAYANK